MLSAFCFSRPGFCLLVNKRHLLFGLCSVDVSRGSMFNSNKLLVSRSHAYLYKLENRLLSFGEFAFGCVLMTELCLSWLRTRDLWWEFAVCPGPAPWMKWADFFLVSRTCKWLTSISRLLINLAVFFLSLFLCLHLHFQTAKSLIMVRASTSPTPEKADQAGRRLWSWSRRMSWRSLSKKTERQWDTDTWKVFSKSLHKRHFVHPGMF